MPPAIRWITGRRTDAGDPGGPVVAVVYAPERWSCYHATARLYCPFLAGEFAPIPGVDEAQSIELAITLVCTLYLDRGVRDIVVSLTPPVGDETC
jgi:hypothetical protein